MIFGPEGRIRRLHRGIERDEADNAFISEGVDLRYRLSVCASLIVVIAVLLSLLSVNVFPFVTNDGVVYLQHSLDLSEGGLVVEGFRQVGYPLFLTVVRWISNLLGVADPLLSTALVQRGLLVAAIGLSAWFCRWWSLPLIAFLATAPNVTYTNFVLTEAVGLPIAVLVVFPTVSFLRSIGAGASEEIRARLRLFGWLAVLGAFLLFSVRFTFGVFAAVPLVMALAAWRTPYRSLGLTLLSVYLILVAAFAVGLTLENRAELDHPSPTAGTGWVSYYYAWQMVFRIHPENQGDSSLARFYDDGNVHHFNNEVSSLGLTYEEETTLFENEIAAMLDAAGISYWGSRLESIGWSFLGGRVHDIAGVVQAAASSTGSSVDEWVYHSRYARQHGRQGFADAFNQGRLPQVVTTDSVGVPLPVPDGQTVASVLMPFAIAVMVGGLRRSPLRWQALVGLLVVSSTAVGHGWFRAENYRFLMTGLAFGIALATTMLSWSACERTQSPSGLEPTPTREEETVAGAPFL